MNKREFVWAAGVAAASGAGVPAAALARGTAHCGEAIASRGPTGDDHGLARWQGRIGESFAVFGTAAPVQLSLHRVDVHGTSCGRTEQFSLVFGRQGPPLADGTQVLAQSGAAPRALYLVQGGSNEAGVPLLRADCSRLI
jgi:hypothetical protein